MNGTHLRRPGRRRNVEFFCSHVWQPGTKYESGDLDFWRRSGAGETARQSREGQVPVQWTAHIPQAMQRHGGSIKPEAEAECDAAMSSFIKGLRRPEPPRESDSRAGAR